MPAPPFEQSVTFLYVADPARSRRFYEDVLGLCVVLEQPGGCVILEIPERRGFLGLCPARGPRSLVDPRTPGGVVVSLVTAAVEAWHAELVEAGVAVLGPPARSEAARITGFFFHDPDGYLLEIQRFEDPAWPAPG